MASFNRLTRALAGLLAATATLVAAPFALGDKIHLKDGRVLEGTVEREGDGFVYFKVKVGSLEQVQFFTSDQFVKIERDEAAGGDKKDGEKKEGEKAAPAGSEKPAGVSASSGATRVAILNFGAPSNWGGEIDDTVGIQVNASAWKEAIPLLEKDKVDVVVVRINSGGGSGSEIPKFLNLFQNEYKKRFRTVGWVESAISAAAMSPYCLEEFYFMPKGSFGACTGWYGNLQNVEGAQLELYIVMMEQASAMGNRDSKIMRSMQIQDPLTATIDERTGQVQWFQDLTGDHVVNPEGQILTLTASDAVKFGFARGVASTKEELAKAMGLGEVEWVGEKATKLVDDNMRASHRAYEGFQLLFNKYGLAVAYAQQTQDKQDRGKHVAVARRHLAELRRAVGTNPNFADMVGADAEWFQEQEELLRELGR